MSARRTAEPPRRPEDMSPQELAAVADEMYRELARLLRPEYVARRLEEGAARIAALAAAREDKAA